MRSKIVRREGSGTVRKTGALLCIRIGKGDPDPRIHRDITGVLKIDTLLVNRRSGTRLCVRVEVRLFDSNDIVRKVRSVFRHLP